MRIPALSFLISSLLVLHVAQASEYYANASTGSDLTGNGSIGSPWRTITHALEQISGTGHTLHIGPGTYNSAIDEHFPILMTNGVSLVGDDANACIVDAAGSNTVIRCVGVLDATTRIEGLTLKGGGNVTYGGGLYISAGSVLTITKCRIISNMLGSDVEYGGGIYVTNASPTIIDDTVSSNKSGGIYVDNGSPLIKGNFIVNNQGVRASGILVTGASSSPRIVGNVVVKNSSSVSTMYGIACASSSHARIINNTIADNVGGVFIDGASPDSIENNILAFNTNYGISENTFGSDAGRVAFNLFFQNGSGLYRDEATTDYFSASTLNGSVAECSANVEGDPRFQDRTGSDYRLRVGSAAFDAGNPDTKFNDPEGTRGDIGAIYLNAPPGAPANLAATRGNGWVTVKWRANTEPDVVRYRVYYGTAPAPTTRMDSTTSRTDTSKTYSLTNNITCYFRVTAVDAAGNESGYSGEVSATPVAAEGGEYLADANTVLLLHMNEANGAAVVDASAYANDGTATGTTVVDGRFGRARSYETSGDEIRINSAASLNFGTGSFTLETWVNTLGYTPSGHPHIKSGSPNNRSWGTWFNSDGTFGGWAANNAEQYSSQACGPTRINDGRWHHVAAVITQSTISTYVDGILDASATVSTPGTPDNDGSLVLGSSWNNFRGILDEVRISNKARTPDEFDVQLPPKNLTANATGSSISLAWQHGGGLAPFLRYRVYRGTDSTNVSRVDSTNQPSCVNSGLATGTRYFYRVAAVDSFGYEYPKSYAVNAVTAPALGEYSPDAYTVLLLHMNEASGSSVTDASASNNNGSANGTTFVQGRFGKGRSYASDGDQINIPHATTLNFGTGSFTLEAWINTQGYTNNGAHPFHKVGSPWHGWHTSVNSDGTIGAYVAPTDQGGSGFSGRIRINDGKWHHVAVVVTQTYITSYIDGALDNISTVWTPGSLDNDGMLNIGSSWNGFRGQLDEIRISNRARTPDEFNVLLPPKNCSASASGNSITLGWQQGGGLAALLRYRVYRGTDSVNVVLLDSTVTTSYQDLSATPGIFYYYRVSAVDSTGFEGGKSACLYSELPLVGEYRPDTSTVFLMHLNQTGGNNLGDVSRNGFHGQFNGGTFVQGRFGNAFQPTSSAGVWTQNFSTVGMENQFTVEAWIMLTGQPTCNGCNFIGLPYMSFNMNPDLFFWFNYTFSDWSGRGLWSPGNTPLPIGKWCHIAFVFNAGEAGLYLNGNLIAKDSYGQSIKTGSGGINFLQYNAPDVFPGLIDEIRVSKVARAPSEFGLQLAPSNVRANLTGSSVHLEWNNGGGSVPCMRYKIYRGADSVNVTAIDSTISTSFDDTKAVRGTSYIYRVAAVDSTNFEGAMSRPLGYSVPLAGEYQVDTSTVLLMHMNQTGGSTVTDVGPQGYYGQANGGTFVTGRFGNAFQAANYYGVIFNNISSVGLEKRTTLETWVKLLERPQVYTRLLSIPNMEIWINEYATVGFSFSLNDGSWMTVSTQLIGSVAGKWYHIAGVYEDSVARLYVNGVCRSTQSYGQPLRTSQGGGCLGNSNDSRTFNGLVDEVRVSNIARSPEDLDLQLPPKGVTPNRTSSSIRLQWQNGGGKIPCRGYKIYRGSDSLNVALIDSTDQLSYEDITVSPGNLYCYRISSVDSTGFDNNEGQNVYVQFPMVGEYGSDASTVLLMHFDQPGATVAFDGSANAYHGAFNGGTFSDGRFGKAHRAVSTNGIGLSSIPSTGMENRMTIEAWVKLDGSLDNRFDIVSMTNMFFHINSDYSLSFDFQLADGNGSGVGTSSALLTIGPWYHVACTFDNGTATIYVNGVPRGTYSPGQSLKTGSGGGSIARMYGENSFSGLVDEVRVSKVARQPGEFGFRFSPTSLAAVASYSSVHLSWQDGGGGVPLMRYRIYRGPDSLSTSLIDSVRDLVYDDRNIVTGRTYCYRVSSVDSSGFEISKGSSVYTGIPLVGECTVDTATVLLMHFDQDSGSVAVDIGPNGYHGRLTAGSFVAGRWGKAYQPANANGIYLQNIPTTGLESQNTLEAWIKLTKKPDDWSSIFSLPWINLGVNTDLSLSGGMTLADGSGQGIGTSGNVLTVGKWHHVVRTHENGVSKILVDGVLCSIRSYGQSLMMGTGSGSLAISNNNGIFPGIIDEVRISKVARQPAQFSFQLQPTGLTAASNGSIIHLAWKNGGGGIPFMRYRIYRGADSTTVVIIDSTVSPFYDDSKAQAGQFYCYRVASVDSTGFEGPLSVATLVTARVNGEYASDTSTVLLMHMDQSGGLAIFDESSNNYHGQMSSGSFVAGRFGRAFQPGSSDGMWFNTMSTVGMENQFTVEMWVKFTNVKNWWSNVINIPSISMSINQDLSFSLNFGLQDGSGGGAWSPSFAMSVGRWYHIAGVFDHGITKVYLNGVVVDSRYYDQSARTSPGGGNIANYNYPDVFPGLIDEVRISKIARNPEDFGLQLPPKDISALATSNSIELSWANGGGSVGCARYKIYRGVDTVNLAPLDSTVGSVYSDTSAAVGILYFYRISAVDSTEFEGARSIAAKAIMSSMGEYQPDSSTVLLYHFNSTGAITEYDASKYGNHGRFDRTASGVGKFGKARQFDDQSWLNLNYSPSLNIGDLDFTLEAWVKAGLQTNWICLMRKWDSNHGMQFYLNGSTGTPAVQLQEEGGTQYTVTGTTKLYDSKWHHIAAIRKSNILYLYVDGSSEGSIDVSSLGSVQGIGGFSFQNGTYSLDEVRISNRARLPEEFDLRIPPHNAQVSKNGGGVALTWQSSGGAVPLLRYRIYRGFDPASLSLFDSTANVAYLDGSLQPGAKYYYRIAAVDSTGFESAKTSAVSIIGSLALGEYLDDANTVLLLHLDELSGKYAGDASSSNNNGSITGTTVTQGKFGRGRLMGSSDVVYVTANSGLSVGAGNFSLEGWLKSPTQSSQPQMFYKWGGSEAGAGFKMFVNVNPPDGKIVFTCRYSGGSTLNLVSTTSITDNGWHHLGATRLGARISLYIDGVLESSTSIAAGGNFSNSYDIQIGTGFSSSVLDEVRISTKARTPQEFNLQLPPAISSPSLSATTITLSWQNGGGLAPLKFYRIYRGPDSTSLSLIDSTVALTYVNTGLATGTKYYYRIAAVDSTGFESVKSYAVNATTQSIPLSPTGLTVVAASYTRMNLNWTDNSNNEDGFRIERKTGTGGVYALIKTTGTNVKTYQDTGLAALTTYFYRVSAYNGAGTSDPCVEQSAITPAEPDVTAPGPPLAPSITSSGWTKSETFTISWTNPVDSSGIAKVWYKYDTPPTADSLGTPLTITGSSGIANAIVPAHSTCGAHALYFYLEDGATPTGNKNPSSCVSVIAKHDDLAPRITHDSLAVVSFNVSSPQNIGIQASASDPHSGVKILQLQYREAGHNWDTPHIVNFPVTGGSAEIRATDITEYAKEGVDYRILSTDSADNSCMTPTHSLLIQHTKTFVREDASGNSVTQMSVSQLPANTATEYAYRMVSVPLQLNDETPRRVLEVETGLGQYDDKQWRFFRLNANSGYDEYPAFAEESVIKPGSAFFLILNAGKTLKVGTGTIVKAEDVNKDGIQLRAGYNFVGNPFNFTVLVDSMTLSTGETMNNRWEFLGVEGTNSGWSPRPASLKPWEGMLLKLNLAAVLRFNVADRSSRTSSRSPELMKATTGKDASPDFRPWSLRVIAVRQDNGLVDSENLFGIEADAADSLDLLDLVEPPMFGGKGLSLSSRVGEDDLSHDFRKPGREGYIWDLRLRTPDKAAKINLSIAGIEDISSEVFLIDLDSKITYRPKSTENILLNSGNGGRRLRLIVGSLEFAEDNSLGIDVIPKQYFLYQNYPNPFNPETMIRYTLPSSEKVYRVTLKVFNILGNEVVSLVEKDQGAGYYEVKFDGRRLSSGTYFCRIFVNGGSNKSSFCDTKKLVLIK